MATSKKQAQALGIKLSRELRAGKEIPPPPRGRYSEKTRKKALRDLEIGRQRKKKRTTQQRTVKRATKKSGVPKRGAKKRSRQR